MLLFLFALVCALIPKAESYTNVLGTALESCSGPGMARTGFMRDGHCTEVHDDRGSHHICIDLSSTSGGNFCSVTGQPNWCESSMGCHESYSQQCPVEHWCVCQWAFASYIQNAGGCDQIQDIVCEATNMVALTAYESQASSSPHVAQALDCLRSRCAVPSTHSIEGEQPVENGQQNPPELSSSDNAPVVPLVISGMVLCVAVGLAAGLFIGKRIAKAKAQKNKENLAVGKNIQVL
ncbi:hypothetical protein TrVE_jg3633 [Triparma verrucosa]|uniref:Uncharacterized protein n=1 Tax=Triparma verrucosa TaxID=1606542 RepID=A0A9W7EUP3_9STRA|nr:hypothetical protein TrVE_jg3633 [Triparma verrucosa]